MATNSYVKQRAFFEFGDFIMSFLDQCRPYPSFDPEVDALLKKYDVDKVAVLDIDKSIFKRSNLKHMSVSDMHDFGLTRSGQVALLNELQALGTR